MEASTQENKEKIKYATLMETSGKHCESWYYFIKYDGNEDALNDLQKQLEKIEFYILGDLSTFDLEIENLITESTAKEMITLDLNHYSFHRKFDGKMKKINLGLKKKYNNDKKIIKCFEILGVGRIDEYVTDEDVDKEDLVEDTSSSTDYEFDIESESSSSSSDSEDEKKKKKKDKKKDKKDKKDK
jgi:hypothetical protein